MLNLTINSFSDMLEVINFFGIEGFNYAVSNESFKTDCLYKMAELKKEAKSSELVLSSFNDGNNEFTVYAVMDRIFKNGVGYIFNIPDVKIIRTGFGGYAKTLRDAVEDKNITLEDAQGVIECFLTRVRVLNALEHPNK